jgi:3-mercaptopyruvate sulfurtransferase SseA
MRSFVSFTAALALALAMFAACNPRDTSAPASNASAAQNSAARALHDARQEPTPATQQTPAPSSDDVRRVTQDELRAAVQKGTVALFDVRDKAAYEAGHIKGAKLVPWAEVETRLDEFPKDKLIVTYCA